MAQSNQSTSLDGLSLSQRPPPHVYIFLLVQGFSFDSRDSIELYGMMLMAAFVRAPFACRCTTQRFPPSGCCGTQGPRASPPVRREALATGVKGVTSNKKLKQKNLG